MFLCGDAGDAKDVVMKLGQDVGSAETSHLNF